MMNRIQKSSLASSRLSSERGSRGPNAAPGYRTLPYSVVEQIGRRIINGEFQPGSVLPNAEDSSASLGVSRTVLREAIKILAGKGLVESRPKTGTRVRPRGDWNFLDPDILSWRYEGSPTEAEVRALFELRQAIEPMAARLAAVHAAADQIEALGRCLAGMAATCDDAAAFAGPDLEFHQAILRMTCNELIGSLGAMIETALVTSFRLSEGNPRGQRHSLPLHQEVAAAIAAHDPAGAERAMLALLEGAQEDVRHALRSRQAPRPARENRR